MTYDYDGRCGSCSNFVAESGERGYCKAYYNQKAYATDSANNCRKYSGQSSSGGGCFLTTACCEERGLADDCYELTTLRRYRDQVLKNNEQGRLLIEFYYKEAPRIVKQIKKSEKRKEICDWIYQQVQRVIKEYEGGKTVESMTDYLFMMYKVDLMSARNTLELI